MTIAPIPSSYKFESSTCFLLKIKKNFCWRKYIWNIQSYALFNFLIHLRTKWTPIICIIGWKQFQKMFFPESKSKTDEISWNLETLPQISLNYEAGFENSDCAYQINFLENGTIEFFWIHIQAVDWQNIIFHKLMIFRFNINFRKTDGP